MLKETFVGNSAAQCKVSTDNVGDFFRRGCIYASANDGMPEQSSIDPNKAVIENQKKLDSLIKEILPLQLEPRYLGLGPGVNGCGPSGNKFISLLIPDLFPECCNQHDIEWGTLGLGKDTANKNFLSCNLKVAGEASNFRRLVELTVAALGYYGAVSSSIGEGAYEEAQEEARTELRLHPPSVLSESNNGFQGNFLLP